MTIEIYGWLWIFQFIRFRWETVLFFISAVLFFFDSRLDARAVLRFVKFSMNLNKVEWRKGNDASKFCQTYLSKRIVGLSRYID